MNEISAMRDELDRFENELRLAREAITALKMYAAVTRVYWDAGQDMRVGKRVAAMAGELTGYDWEIDDALSRGSQGVVFSLPQGG